MTLGIAVFPRDTWVDHPLIVGSSQRRCKATATGLHNAVENTRNTNDLGNLSDTITNKIIGQTQASTQKTFQATRYPLFGPVLDESEAKMTDRPECDDSLIELTKKQLLP
jgi:hypothetical protein